MTKYAFIFLYIIPFKIQQNNSKTKISILFHQQYFYSKGPSISFGKILHMFKCFPCSICNKHSSKFDQVNFGEWRTPESDVT